MSPDVFLTGERTHTHTQLLLLWFLRLARSNLFLLSLQADLFRDGLKVVPVAGLEELNVFIEQFHVSSAQSDVL